MSALVMADEHARYLEGERVVARFGVFFSLFLWPLTLLGIWVLTGIALMIFDLPHWLGVVLPWLVLLGFVWYARSHLRALRERAVSLDAWYAAPLSDAVAADQRLVTGATIAPETVTGLERWVLLIQHCLFAAPLASARALHARTPLVTWDEAQIVAAQALFEKLGAAGETWSACSAFPEQAEVMPGLERLELTEHRISQANRELRLRPDIRRRYFPKDSAAAFFAPTRRR